MWKIWLSIKTELWTSKGYGHESSKFNICATMVSRRPFYVWYTEHNFIIQTWNTIQWQGTSKHVIKEPFTEKWAGRFLACYHSSWNQSYKDANKTKKPSAKSYNDWILCSAKTIRIQKKHYMYSNSPINIKTATIKKLNLHWNCVEH